MLPNPLVRGADVQGAKLLETLSTATAWVNSSPLGPGDLRGRVVLVDFWTYTCINWIRTLPHLRAWSEKYRDHGLTVIGVHTPEFGFEQNVGNVQRAVLDQRVHYPVAVDSSYRIWNAFGNQYWPALYLIDAEGRLRKILIGESDYEDLEPLIQQLLGEAGYSGFDREPATVSAVGAEAPADWRNLRSPETYVGYWRSERFASPQPGRPDRLQTYSLPRRLGTNEWALAGPWTIRNEFAVLNGVPGRIAYRFHSRDVHVVLAPAEAGRPVRFRATIDGRPPGRSSGADVDANGYGIVDRPRMYQVIRQAVPIDARELHIEFLDGSVAVYAFTFG